MTTLLRQRGIYGPAVGLVVDLGQGGRGGSVGWRSWGSVSGLGFRVQANILLSLECVYALWADLTMTIELRWEASTGMKNAKGEDALVWSGIPTLDRCAWPYQRRSRKHDQHGLEMSRTASHYQEK